MNDHEFVNLICFGKVPKLNDCPPLTIWSTLFWDHKTAIRLKNNYCLNGWDEDCNPDDSFDIDYEDRNSFSMRRLCCTPYVKLSKYQKQIAKGFAAPKYASTSQHYIEGKWMYGADEIGNLFLFEKCSKG